MKFYTPLSIASAVLIITACHTSKKTTTSTTSEPVTNTAPTKTLSATEQPATFGPSMGAKSADGIYLPGEEEVAALQPRYMDITLAKLREGYTLYTSNACTRCHGAVNVYQISDMNWMNIIIRMAYKANITDSEKDAVYKYVLAIKAAKPK